ncbi:MAG: deoxyribose-phosphate aldolase [Bacilli bacterium]|jgi:deoxyribose-phosphate aldolase
MELNKYIDHTYLKPIGTEVDIEKLCQEALNYDFASVCVQPCYVKKAKALLKKSNVAIGTVIGFPLGANTIETKVYEIKQALKNGADEVDAVINIGALKAKNYEYLEKEVEELVKAASDHILKIIIEISYLDDIEIIKMCEICRNKFVNFIKTSTGFSESGATIEAVKLMKAHAGDLLEVKASGGIRTYEDTIKYIEAGASRIGTSSGVKIMEESAK